MDKTSEMKFKEQQKQVRAFIVTKTLRPELIARSGVKRDTVNKALNAISLESLKGKQLIVWQTALKMKEDFDKLNQLE